MRREVVKRPLTIFNLLPHDKKKEDFPFGRGGRQKTPGRKRFRLENTPDYLFKSKGVHYPKRSRKNIL